MDDEATLAEIRRTARVVLDTWPEARAAVLFGSRARGTHGPHSDWDIAFITAGDGDRCGVVPDGLPLRYEGLRNEVNDIAIPEKLVERTALCIGHIGRGIAVDGRVLVGDWSRPKMEGAPVMAPDRYLRSLYTSLGRIREAIGASADIGRGWPRDFILVITDQFVAATVDAAGYLAKAVLGRHGIDGWRTHDLNELADQARQAGLGTLADDVARMNGATGRDRLAGDHSADRDSLARAIGRLPAVLDLTRRELAALPADFLAPRETAHLVDTAVSRFREEAARLRSALSRDGADMTLPAPVDWITPLLRNREILAAALDAAARISIATTGSRRRQSTTAPFRQGDAGGRTLRRFPVQHRRQPTGPRLQPCPIAGAGEAGELRAQRRIGPRRGPARDPVRLDRQLKPGRSSRHSCHPGKSAGRCARTGPRPSPPRPSRDLAPAIARTDVPGPRTWPRDGLGSPYRPRRQSRPSLCRRKPATPPCGALVASCGVSRPRPRVPMAHGPHDGVTGQAREPLETGQAIVVSPVQGALLVQRRAVASTSALALLPGRGRARGTRPRPPAPAGPSPLPGAARRRAARPGLGLSRGCPVVAVMRSTAWPDRCIGAQAPVQRV